VRGKNENGFDGGSPKQEQSRGREERKNSAEERQIMWVEISGGGSLNLDCSCYLLSAREFLLTLQ